MYTLSIIGTGAVGATTAYACMMLNSAAKIILVDIDQRDCLGEVMDLSDSLSFSNTSKISIGNLKEAGQADIIIITAGKAQKEGQTRATLLKDNKAIMQDIIDGLQPINKNALLIVVTNPVDTLTYFVQNISGLKRHQVFGSGTMLDSQRLRNFISQAIGIAEQSIHAYIIGEHGDSQVAALSGAQIAGQPLTRFLSKNTLQNISEKTKDKVYKIIACKGNTSYGVASCIAATCQNIIFDQKRVMPVSCYIEQYDVCMSMPTIIGKQGILGIIQPQLDPQEQRQLELSTQKLQKMKKLLG